MQKISAGVFKNFSRFFFILALLFLTLTACQSADFTHQEGKNTLSETPEHGSFHDKTTMLTCVACLFFS